MFLQLADGNGRLIPDPETWINSFTERGTEAMDEGHGFSYTVEGQGASSVVQEHTDTRGVGRVDLHLVLAMAGRVARVRAEETPGLAVVPNSTAVPIACPLDALVGDTDGGPLSTPIHLPVEAASRQGLLTQNLGQTVKSGRTVTVGLGVSLQGGLPVPSRQIKLLVGCVGVQSQRTGI